MGEFTQEDMDAAVAAAIADATSSMNQRIAELEAAAMETEVGKAVAEAVTAKDAEISDLQAKLDAAEAAKTAAEARVTELEAAEAKRLEDELTAARREERVAKAKEIGVLSDEYVDKNADRFAAMSDDEWAGRVDEWAAIADAAGSSKTPPPPSATVLEATRISTSGESGSALSLIGAMRRGALPTAT